MPDGHNYWFPAKSYGWGWGLPITWQGWVVFIAFFVLLIGGSVVILPRYGTTIFTAYTLLLAAALILICWYTGEPPSWRWGND